MTHTELLQRLVSFYRYKTYLEIGVRRTGDNFDKIDIEYKWGVDPVVIHPSISCVTSDKFFEEEEDYYWDLIFIDGDHRWTTVLRDVENSLQSLVTNGTIVLHDCWPVREEHSQLTYWNGAKNVPGNGSVWKACSILRMSRSDIHMQYIDVGDGSMIIQRVPQELWIPPFKPDVDLNLTWDFWQRFKHQMFPLKSLEDFLNGTT